MSETSRSSERKDPGTGGVLTTAVLGASPKADRYAHMAFTRLRAAGHPVIPVNPAYSEIEGVSCAGDVAEAVRIAGPGGLHTLTVYVGPAHLEPLIPSIVEAAPKRVVFNPGSESETARRALDSAGIPWIEACTLVLLSTDQY